MNVKHASQNEISNFLDLISPISIDDFKENYWNKKVLHIQRKEPLYYSSLINISDIDHILDVSRPKGGSLRIVKNQEPLSPSKYENKDGSLNLNQIYAAYSDGYTLVINEIDRFWKPIKDFCQNSRQLLSHKIRGNMYLTPRNQKALLPHYDTHDVFVVQVEGKKEWKIYDEPYKTPLVDSFQPIFQREQLSNVQSITLNAGDIMYIPRGVPHEAHTTDESSLHLTIGVYPMQLVDFMTESLQQLALSNESLRQSLPIGYLSQEEERLGISQKIKELSESIFSNISEEKQIINTIGLISEKFRMETPSSGNGHFENLDQLEQITIESIVCVRDNMNCKTYQDGSFARILFSGNVIKGPISIIPCFKFIASNQGEFKVSSIPLLDDKNKIKLIRRLIRGGLLEVIN